MMYRCVSCNQPTLTDRPGTTNEICSVCQWEDDYVANQDTDIHRGNDISLSVARKNFKRFGTSHPRGRKA